MPRLYRSDGCFARAARLLAVALALVAAPRCTKDEQAEPASPKDAGVAGAKDAPGDADGAKPDASGGAGGTDGSSGAGGDGAAGGDAGDAESDASAADGGFAPQPVPGSKCGAVIQAHPVGAYAHVADCAPIAFATNPPCWGDHYGSWVAWRSYPKPVPRGYLVHNLEHAGVVIWYNCPGGCAAEVAAAEAFAASLPPDPLCPEGGPPARRVVLVPDPLLEVKWAASSWGVTLRASCFEAPSFAKFFADHYAKGPENFCSQGVEPWTEGGLDIPPGCGQPGGG